MCWQNFKLSIRSTFILLFFVTFSARSMAQIVIDNSAPYDSPQYLVESVLLGQGVLVDTIEFRGDSAIQIAYFDGTNSNIGLNSGVVLCNGDVADLVPGVTLGTQVNNPWVDNDLTTLAQSVPPLIGQSFTVASTDDAAVLEFDFIPAGDSLRFNFVFGSDEYQTYINTQYNDVFGFFISGPGISGPYAAPPEHPNGAMNIALVPGSIPALPITISSVQPALNAAYYIDNPGNSTVGLNGFTTVIVAEAIVQCNQTYHIKLAIADGTDNYLDSGVFLEAESFSTNDVVISLSTGVTSLDQDSAVVEGCTEATFTFTRADTLEADTIIYTIGGDAINGVDYQLIDTMVIIPQGQTTATLDIIPLSDTLTEGTELIQLSIFKVTACGDTISVVGGVYILEDYQIYNAGPAQYLSSCPGDSVLIVADATNGIPNFTYLWNTGDTLDSLWVTPFVPDTFFLEINDSCAVNPGFDTVYLDFDIPQPQVTMSNDTIIYCLTGTVDIQATGINSGSNTPYVYNWSNGDNTNIISATPVGDTTLFYVTVTDMCGINDTIDSVMVLLQIPVLQLVMSNDTTTQCADDTAIPYVVSGGGGTEPYSYSWSTAETGMSITVNPADTTVYYVTMTDDCGAPQTVDSVIVNVTHYDTLLIGTNDTTVLCAGDPINLGTFVTGGLAPYTYGWDNGGANSNMSMNINETDSFIVIVTDQCASIDADTVIVVVPVYGPLDAITYGTGSVHCPGDGVEISAAGVGGADFNYTYVWELEDDSLVTENSIVVQVNGEQTYSLTITDGCGFSDIEEAIVDIPTYDPIIIETTEDTIICKNDSVAIGATVTGGDGVFSYLWSSSHTNISSPNELTTFIMHLETDMYEILVTDGCGVTGVASVEVVVEDCDVVVPLVFTPNGDDVNDYFIISNLDKFPTNSLTVFNRWGQVVLGPTFYDNTWNGGSLSDGTYFWILDLPEGKGGKGYVMLLR